LGNYYPDGKKGTGFTDVARNCSYLRGESMASRKKTPDTGGGKELQVRKDRHLLRALPRGGKKGGNLRLARQRKWTCARGTGVSRRKEVSLRREQQYLDDRGGLRKETVNAGRWKDTIGTKFRITIAASLKKSRRREKTRGSKAG